APGSFARADRVRIVPSGAVRLVPVKLTGLALTVGRGATFVTVIVAAPVPASRSDPTAITRTSYRALSSGVKVKSACCAAVVDAAVAYGVVAASLNTCQE